MENKQLKKKIIGINAIMSDKNLSKQIFAALDSTPGSTKRKKALAIIDTINRTYDGRGGNNENVSPFNMEPPVAPGMGQQGQLPSATPRPMTTTPEAILPPGVDPDLQKRLTERGATPEQISTLTPEYQKEFQKPGKLKRFFLPAATPKADRSSELIQGLQAQRPAVTPSDEGDYSDWAKDLLGEQDATPEDVSFMDKWRSGLSEEQKKQFTPLMDVFEAGMGKMSAAKYIMDDFEKLSTLFPGTPKDALPYGSSLVRQVGDLRDRLKEENKINQIQDNLTRLQERGLTIETDLTNYIRGRDEYIEKIDNMIDKTTESMYEMSNLGDPRVSKSLNKYLNYLHIMKGKQQQRYTDYLKSAITYHDAELTRAENSYDTAYNRFKEEFDLEADIAEEDYNRIYETIQEMYTNLEKAEKTQLELEILRQNRNQEITESAIDELELISTLSEIERGASDLTDAQKFEANTWRNTYGIDLPQESINFIFGIKLSGKERSELISNLSVALSENPSLDINQFIEDFRKSRFEKEDKYEAMMQGFFNE